MKSTVNGLDTKVLSLQQVFLKPSVIFYMIHDCMTMTDV